MSALSAAPRGVGYEDVTGEDFLRRNNLGNGIKEGYKVAYEIAPLFSSNIVLLPYRLRSSHKPGPLSL